MSIAFDLLCCTVLFTIPTALLLSQMIGVAGWGYPSSACVFRKPSAAWPFMNNAAYSASNAEETTEAIITRAHVFYTSVKLCLYKVA
jgi:hypothetical protein